MAQTHTQISAYISEETKNLVERYVRARGVKKGFLIKPASGQAIPIRIVFLPGMQVKISFGIISKLPPSLNQ